MMEAFHAHGVELRVHVRVVDDLPDQEDALRGELGAGFVGVFDGPVHAVAEAELAGQFERQVAGDEGISAPANLVYEAAVVVGRERAFDDALEAKSPAEIGLFHGWQSNREPGPAGP